MVNRFKCWLLNDYFIICVMFFAAIFVFNSVFSDAEVSNPIVVTPRMIQTTYKSGEPLKLEIAGSIVRAHCDTYVERNVATDSGKVVWSEITPIMVDVKPSDQRLVTISIKIKTLPPGKYFYRAVVHATCGTDTFAKSSPLLSFEII